jgi:beta-lactamase class A
LFHVVGSNPRGNAVAVLQSNGEALGTPPENQATVGAAEVPPAPPGSVSGPLPGLGEAVGDPVLLEVIENALGDGATHAAVSVRRISDGRSASVNGDYQFYAASTFKLAVLYEAELRHFRGELAYDDTLFITEEDAAEDLGTSGYLEFEEDGSIRVGNLLDAMIRVSDNSSAVALLHKLGSANVDATLRGLGIEAMTVNKVELWTTADDLARLMQAIYVGEGVGPEEREHMRALLLGQTIRSGIPAAIEDQFGGSALIGNKTGTWEGAQHDVAFVEAQTGAYVIAILTDGSYEGWEAVQRVARDVHEKFASTP